MSSSSDLPSASPHRLSLPATPSRLHLARVQLCGVDGACVSPVEHPQHQQQKKGGRRQRTPAPTVGKGAAGNKGGGFRSRFPPRCSVIVLLFFWLIVVVSPMTLSSHPTPHSSLPSPSLAGACVFLVRQRRCRRTQMLLNVMFKQERAKTPCGLLLRRRVTDTEGRILCSLLAFWVLQLMDRDPGAAASADLVHGYARTGAAGSDTAVVDSRRQTIGGWT